MPRQVYSSFVGLVTVALVVGLARMAADRPDALAQAAAAGSIAGTVHYSGTPPERAVLQMAADPFCVTAHAGQTVLSEQVVVNDNGTLRWAFVHVREARSGVLPAGAGGTVELNQVACMYTPHVLGMQAGSTIRVINSDRTLHNVNVQPRNNPAFNPSRSRRPASSCRPTASSTCSAAPSCQRTPTSPSMRASGAASSARPSPTAALAAASRPCSRCSAPASSPTRAPSTS